MIRRQTAAIIPIALVFTAFLAASAGAAYYDDVQITDFSVIVQDKTDKVSDKSLDVYEKSQLQVGCEYQYLKTGKGAALPWVAAHLYVGPPSAGVNLVFSTSKGCLKDKCTAQGLTPQLPPGKVKIGCKITPEGSSTILKEKFTVVTVIPKPVKPLTTKAPATAVVAKPSEAVLAAAAKPNLSVTGAQAKIEANCQSPQPAMTVAVTIKNDGGALPAGKGIVFVKEFGGANLGSGGIQIPALGAGQTQTVNIPAITLQPYSSLAGAHQVQVILNPQQSEGGQLSFNKPAAPYVFSATFPPGHCKPTQRQAPGTNGSQPGSPSTQVPAVQGQPGPPNAPQPAQPQRR